METCNGECVAVPHKFCDSVDLSVKDTHLARRRSLLPREQCERPVVDLPGPFALTRRATVPKITRGAIAVDIGGHAACYL